MRSRVAERGGDGMLMELKRSWYRVDCGCENVQEFGEKRLVA